MVLGLLDDLVAGQPALTVPKVTITFGAAGGGAGGLLGGLAAVVGLAGVGPGLADGLAAMRLHRGVAPDVDWAEMLLAPVPGGPDLPAPGDTGSVEIGAGPSKAGFACTVDLAEPRPDGSLRLTATNGGRLLARARREIAFAERKPGEIVDALCAEAGVESDGGSAGEALPRFVVDEGRSLLDHIARLAETAGRLALFDDAGKLVLVDDTAKAEPVATLALGAALLDARLARREAVGRVVIDGAGAGERGGNAWAWLRKEAGPHRAEAGSGEPGRRHAAPWVRSPDASAALAEAQGRSVARAAAQGRFLAAGVPAITPGALFDVTGTAQDGLWRALTVDLRFDLAAGLVSEIRAAPFVGGGGGLLGGLL
ncbi:hypothetical protein GI374_12110 [Paracoccus sp. S-4012]|uniref:hypothetical protein n=1 Tax=Paracoccus sp. S-4012 TaxID=2665648 RepID=UPI0012B02C46|nr:hypothetical protein [Paracoccus sp. S-4012]MRX51179.1 hypothetical protein [Paracoccus sp. S-4012]